MKEVWILILLTLAPFLELRASIPYGIFQTDLNLFWVVIIATLTNIALAPILYLFLNYVVHLFLKVKKIDKIWKKVIGRTQRKIHPYVEKYGIIGLALFIGIPLPGSGVYSGAIGAYILGYEFKEFFTAAVIGVIIAAMGVTLISIFGQGAWLWFIRQ